LCRAISSPAVYGESGGNEEVKPIQLPKPILWVFSARPTSAVTAVIVASLITREDLATDKSRGPALCPARLSIFLNPSRLIIPASLAALLLARQALVKDGRVISRCTPLLAYGIGNDQLYLAAFACRVKPRAASPALLITA
jgi:hypothetical protein